MPENVYAFGCASRMRPPEVLSFREFRAGLAATLRRVQAGPVFVGSRRRAGRTMIETGLSDHSMNTPIPLPPS
jgi:hypothetical protein